MRIGVIGSGNVGRALGSAFRRVGHEVTVGSRSPDQEALVTWAASSGGSVGTFAEAAAAGEVLVLATAWAGTENALSLAGAEALSGKVLLDATNPLRFTTGLELVVGLTDSGGEQVQRWAPGARVVKAFNTTGFELMDQPSLPGGPPTLFLAGDDDDAKQVAGTLAGQLGWETFDCGPLRSARYTEPMALVWIEHAMRSGTRAHALKMLSG